jgi:hypothetical protein
MYVFTLMCVCVGLYVCTLMGVCAVCEYIHTGSVTDNI